MAIFIPWSYFNFLWTSQVKREILFLLYYLPLLYTNETYANEKDAFCTLLIVHYFKCFKGTKQYWSRIVDFVTFFDSYSLLAFYCFAELLSTILLNQPFVNSILIDNGYDKGPLCCVFVCVLSWREMIQRTMYCLLLYTLGLLNRKHKVYNRYELRQCKLDSSQDDSRLHTGQQLAPSSVRWTNATSIKYLTLFIFKSANLCLRVSLCWPSLYHKPHFIKNVLNCCCFEFGAMRQNINIVVLSSWHWLNISFITQAAISFLSKCAEMHSEFSSVLLKLIKPCGIQQQTAMKLIILFTIFNYSNTYRKLQFLKLQIMKCVSFIKVQCGKVLWGEGSFHHVEWV